MLSLPLSLKLRFLIRFAFPKNSKYLAKFNEKSKCSTSLNNLFRTRCRTNSNEKKTHTFLFNQIFNFPVIEYRENGDLERLRKFWFQGKLFFLLLLESNFMSSRLLLTETFFSCFSGACKTNNKDKGKRTIYDLIKS